MLYVNEGMNKLPVHVDADIGRGDAGHNALPAADLLPADELAMVLRSICFHGVAVSVESSRRLPSGVTIDLQVVGPRGAFGIICDALDARKIRQRPEILAQTSMDRIYCVSALDSMVNPWGIARSLARTEPGYFRRSSTGPTCRIASIDVVRAVTGGATSLRVEGNRVDRRAGMAACAA